RLRHARMLDRAAHEMAGRFTCEAKDRQVVRLGGAAREDDLVSIGVEQCSGLFARVLQSLPGTPSDAVRAGRIAVRVGRVRPHRLPDGRQHRRRGVVVEINAIYGHGVSSLHAQASRGPIGGQRILRDANRTTRYTGQSRFGMSYRIRKAGNQEEETRFALVSFLSSCLPYYSSFTPRRSSEASMSDVPVLPLCLIALLVVPVRAADTVTAKNGAVVTVSGPASEVGVAVLKDGGNAVDAAVATAFALAVTWPEAGNIGGGGYMVVHGGGEPVAFDFRETAPRAAAREMFVKPAARPAHRRVGVPGTVRGLALAHEKRGKRPWRDLVLPAVKLARDGFALDTATARSLNGVLRSAKSDERAEL